MSKLSIKPFFDEVTNTISYVVCDLATRLTAVIDPVLDYDPSSGTLGHESPDKIINYLDNNNLKLEWILETHAHADHVTASDYLQAKRGGEIGIGEHICDVQDTFKKVFNLEPGFVTNGSQFGQLFADGEVIKLGNIDIHIMHTPGHTPACVSYLIEDAVFVGDALFMPDFGTARCDFPSGSATVLFHSIGRLLALPQTTRLFVGHDYKAPGREKFAWESTILEQLQSNIHIKKGTTVEQFVTMRTNRDSQLPVPKLLLPAIQMNIRAGKVPETEGNGVSYLKIPLTIE